MSSHSKKSKSASQGKASTSSTLEHISDVANRFGADGGGGEASAGGRGRTRRTGILAGNRTSNDEDHERKRGSSLSRNHVNRARADRRNRSSDARARHATATGGRKPMRRSSSVNALHGPRGRRGNVGIDAHHHHVPGSAGNDSAGHKKTPRPQLEKASSQSSFSKYGGYHASAGASVGASNLEDKTTLEMEISFGSHSTAALHRPRSASPSALKYTSETQSIFARRGKKDLRTVDQSVNLMDAEAGNYQSRVSSAGKAKPRKSVMDFMLGGFNISRTTSGSSAMTSMDDVDLGPDPSRRRMTHFYLQQKAAQEDNPWNRCCNGIGKATKPIRKLLCSAPFLAAVVIILTLFFWMPYLQDTYNRLPTSPPTPLETPGPTQAPTAETPEPTAKASEPMAAPAVAPSVSEQEAAEGIADLEEDAAVAVADKNEQGETVVSDKALGTTESEKDPMSYTASGRVKTLNVTESRKDPIVNTASGEMKTLNKSDLVHTASGEVTKKSQMKHSASGKITKESSPDANKADNTDKGNSQEQETVGAPSVEADDGGVTKKSSDSLVDKVMSFISVGTSSEQAHDEPVGAGSNETTPVSFSAEQEAEFEKMVLRMVEIQRLVTGRNLTSMEDLHNPTSPQNLALTWLITTTSGSDDSRRRRRLDSDSGSHHDSEESNSKEEDDDFRTVERYVAAVLFFSLHNASEIAKMNVDLYFAIQHNHVWKESDLWAHGYGFDGLPLGNESQYSYNDSTYYQYYWNYSDYHSKEADNGTNHDDYYHYYYGMSESDYWGSHDADGNPRWDASDFEADYGFDWSDTKYSQHFDSNGKSLWNKEKMAYEKQNSEPVSREESGVTNLKHSGNAPTNGGRVLDTPVSGSQGSVGGGTALEKPSPLKVFALAKHSSATKPSEGRYLRRRRLLDSFLRGKWMSGEDICKWKGVHCNVRKQVVKLDLAGRHLKGSIPSEIEGLENLRILDLSENHLHGSIPSEIGSLKILHELLLQGNKLQGQVPSTLEEQPLLVVRLDNNKLGGPIPTNVATLTSLKELWLNHNALNGTLPSELEGMVGLQKLHLEINHFTGPVPNFLTNAANLLTVRLHKNLFTGTIPASLCAATDQSLHFLSADCKSGVVCNCCHLCY